MLKIKLSRTGKSKQPHYRIVVNEARDKRDGRVADTIGHYAPTQEPKLLQIDMPKFEEWVKKGAQPTNTVQALYTRLKSGNPFPPKAPKLSKKAKAKLEAAKAAPAETAAEKPAEPVVETPAAEEVAAAA
jgi:small subunit ribosomal protein S16